jgi:uncharacterized radical SAM superfamily Fe-S cluster-containing enzyme
MSHSPASTESLCPRCLRRVPALRSTEGDSVFLERSCPTHGRLDRVLIWKNSVRTYAEWDRQNGGSRQRPGKSPQSDPGCPFECGICSSHGQDTCTAIVEVTRRCNLRCPVCFAASEAGGPEDPDINGIAGMLRCLIERGEPFPIQFSGGEPTLRDDLPEIVALARAMGFDHIQVNTNGMRLARDPDYARALKESGTTTIFLQFDGLTEEVHTRIRGTALARVKQQAIERCSELKLGVILVPTLVKGINVTQIGPILQFAKKWIPVVKGVHFQPITYLGRYPGAPNNEDRLLIPDILQAIETQTGGELTVGNFLPPGCEEPHCSFSAFAILGADGRLLPTTRFENAPPPGKCCGGDAAKQSRNYVRNRWKYRESVLTGSGLPIETDSACGCGGSSEDLFERLHSHSLCISGMAFQDAWNIDLERLRRCCVHVVTPDETLVPFCVYYLTGSDGKRLHTMSRRS